MLNGVVKSPASKTLKAVRMHTVPNMNGNTCKPYLEIVTLKNFKTIYSGKDKLHQTRFKATANNDEIKETRESFHKIFGNATNDESSG